MVALKWRAAVWAVLALGLVLTPASAAPPIRTATANSAAIKKVNNANNANNTAALTTLHQARMLLQTAIHDYDGHRARAVTQVNHAIHELAPHHTHPAGAKAAGANKAANANAGGGAKGTTPGETQAQSDAKLNQAMQLLSGMSIAGNHPKAAGHVQAALAELNTALKIK